MVISNLLAKLVQGDRLAMTAETWESLTTGKKFISDVRKNINGIDSNGNPRIVGRYGVWYPIPENKRNFIKQTHQIVEIGNDLPMLLSKHSISPSMVYKIA